MPRTVNIFSILVTFAVFGLVFYILKAEIDQSLELLSNSYMSEYKSVLSLLLLLLIMLILLLLALTCTYSKFLQMLGVSDQIELQRNQIFFNLIQLSIDNFIDNNEDHHADPIYEANPPDYNSILIEPDTVSIDLNNSEKLNSESNGTSSEIMPPSYEVALSKESKVASNLGNMHSEYCITSCSHH